MMKLANKMSSEFMIIYEVGIIVLARDIMNSYYLSFYHLCWSEVVPFVV
jgi:hypothetical protein